MQLEVISHQPENKTHDTPLLFVHGAWHGAWCWENFLPYFAQQGYEAHALSLRGHGGSQGHDKLRWTSIHDYVADVAQIAQTLSSPPVVIGPSMGGYVVQ
jgi:pimeloyl-ACP methyl ester carboxylesterase